MIRRRRPRSHRALVPGSADSDGSCRTGRELIERCLCGLRPDEGPRGFVCCKRPTRNVRQLCDANRSSRGSTTTGAKRTALRRASRRQENNCFCVRPRRRATSETTAPGASDSSTAAAFVRLTASPFSADRDHLNPPNHKVTTPAYHGPPASGLHRQAELGKAQPDWQKMVQQDGVEPAARGRARTRHELDGEARLSRPGRPNRVGAPPAPQSGGARERKRKSFPDSSNRSNG